MVERFNRNLKLVLHAAYADGQDPEEEVATYRSTPHTVTGFTPNKLMFNHEIGTKLPSLPTKSQVKHHKEARKRDQKTKEKTKVAHDKKHRARQVDIQVGDKVYRRNEKLTTTKGPWEPVPHQVTRTRHNQITGTRRDMGKSTRDRSDWKLVKERPEHLQFPMERPEHHQLPSTTRRSSLPTVQENVFEEEDMWDDFPAPPPTKPATRAATRLANRVKPTEGAQAAPPPPPPTTTTATSQTRWRPPPR